MRPLKNFEEFVSEGIINKRHPDLARAKSLIEESEKRKEFLNEILIKIGLSENNANYFIENSYDVLIELIRAKLLIEGFSSSGKGAHEAAISYMRKLGFSEKNARFMNDLRYFRNGILYYGKIFDVDYAKKVLNFLDELYPKLKRIIHLK
ncbi:MAG: hypothetical protein KKF68_02610 [Nanoarchaeota archaeon]|nr:hypothetical protein [Nanoarchaeota archaeon]